MALPMLILLGQNAAKEKVSPCGFISEAAMLLHKIHSRGGFSFRKARALLTLVRRLSGVRARDLSLNPTSIRSFVQLPQGFGAEIISSF
jgi:hypothetical protein